MMKLSINIKLNFRCVLTALLLTVQLPCYLQAIMALFGPPFLLILQVVGVPTGRHFVASVPTYSVCVVDLATDFIFLL